jgi:hypothetical protein
MKKEQRKTKKTAVKDLKPKKEVKGGATPINDRKKPVDPING